MAISNFIPTVWSETLYSQLDKKYIAVANCNREFEGDIKGMGSVVKICGVGNVNVSDYTKNTDMDTPQSLSDTVKELTIDQAKYFNFQIDDIDKAQASPKLMDAAMKVAANALSNEADKYIYSLYNKAGNTVSLDVASESGLLKGFMSAITLLYKNNVSNTSDIVIEVSPEVAERLLSAKINLANDNADMLENGKIGKIGGCDVFVSNNIVTTTGDVLDTRFHKCLVRTKRAIAFAEQLSEINAYRPEKRFADAVKGLHLYGAEVVYPNEMVLVDVGELYMG